MQRDDDRAVLEVADRGPGGTGLAIVKATVDAHGGDMTLCTAAGQRTAVRVELPILEGGDQFAGPVPSKQSDRA